MTGGVNAPHATTTSSHSDQQPLVAAEPAAQPDAPPSPDAPQQQLAGPETLQALRSQVQACLDVSSCPHLEQMQQQLAFIPAITSGVLVQCCHLHQQANKDPEVFETDAFKAVSTTLRSIVSGSFQACSGVAAMPAVGALTVMVFQLGYPEELQQTARMAFERCAHNYVAAYRGGAGLTFPQVAVLFRLYKYSSWTQLGNVLEKLVVAMEAAEEATAAASPQAGSSGMNSMIDQVEVVRRVLSKEDHERRTPELSRRQLQLLQRMLAIAARLYEAGLADLSLLVRLLDALNAMRCPPEQLLAAITRDRGQRFSLSELTDEQLERLSAALGDFGIGFYDCLAQQHPLPRELMPLDFLETVAEAIQARRGVRQQQEQSWLQEARSMHSQTERNRRLYEIRCIQVARSQQDINTAYHVSKTNAVSGAGLQVVCDIINTASDHLPDPRDPRGTPRLDDVSCHTMWILVERVKGLGLLVSAATVAPRCTPDKQRTLDSKLKEKMATPGKVSLGHKQMVRSLENLRDRGELQYVSDKEAHLPGTLLQRVDVYVHTWRGFYIIFEYDGPTHYHAQGSMTGKTLMRNHTLGLAGWLAGGQHLPAGVAGCAHASREGGPAAQQDSLQVPEGGACGCLCLCVPVCGL